MLELLNTYSLIEIIIFIITLAIAIKSFVTFWDWAVVRLRKVFHKEDVEEKNRAKMKEHLKQNYENIRQVSLQQQDLENRLVSLANKIDLLIDSDKDDIKSFLTKEHHYFCYQKGWIDDYSLECCERRYQHYHDEGGNSFIEGFMKELRALPKHPPTAE